MESNEATHYYLSQKENILKAYDKTSKHTQRVLLQRFGQDKADEIIAQTRNELEKLLVDLPYVGGKENPLTSDLVESAMALALYRVLKPTGIETREIGEIIYKTLEGRAESYPRVLRRLFGWYNHSHFGQRSAKKRIIKLQKQQYSGNWVANWIEGVRDEFDFGVDYTECAICKFYEKMNASDLSPYICLADFVIANATYQGFKRTTTIAEGSDRCDFRWKKGLKTAPGWPPHWLEE